MRITIGIEGTFAPSCGKDTLAIIGHYRGQRWRRDLEAIRALGITEFRYPIPWHRIEASPGEYDWRFLDLLIPFAVDDLGLTLIADPLHHTSYPSWLERGFLDPAFGAH